MQRPPPCRTPASNGGAAVTGYQYRYAQGTSVSAETAWTAAGQVLSLTVGGLANGTAYAFEVRAVNRVGHSPTARATATVLQLPTLSAHDARAQEGVDTAIDFAVSLNRASTLTVTVDYATAEGSAKVGEDYRRTAGTLTFPAGEIEKTVSVPLLDDAKDENEETFTLVLSNASGARLVRARATATISNDGDAMPRAWLLRFGRTVAGQVVDAMTTRFDGPTQPHMTVAGVPVAAGGSPTVLEDRPLGPTLRAVMLGSSFHLSAEETGEGATASAWGRASAARFEARVGDARMDGTVATGILGIDAAWDDIIAGAAVSYSEGEGSFAMSGDTATNRASGALESTLAGVYPYVQLRPNDRTSVWGLAGVGRGDLTLTEEGGAPIRTGTSLVLGALGAEASLAPAAETGGVALTLKSDGFWVRTASDAVHGDRTGNLKAATGEATRARLTLQGERAFELGEGKTLAPRIEAGVRYDGGDADAELGYGLRAPGGRGVVTPYGGLSLSDDGNRRMRLGARWVVVPAVTLDLEASRDVGSGEPHVDALIVRAAARW